MSLTGVIANHTPSNIALDDVAINVGILGVLGGVGEVEGVVVDISPIHHHHQLRRRRRKGGGGKGGGRGRGGEGKERGRRGGGLMTAEMK